MSSNISEITSRRRDTRSAGYSVTESIANTRASCNKKPKTVGLLIYCKSVFLT